MPKAEPQFKPPFLGFTKTAEVWNSRASMIGIIGIFIVELVSILFFPLIFFFYSFIIELFAMSKISNRYRNNKCLVVKKYVYYKANHRKFWLKVKFKTMESNKKGGKKIKKKKLLLI